MSNNGYKLAGEFVWALLFVCILIAVVFAWNMVLENGRHYHDTRIESVESLLAGYESCKIESIAVNEGSIRNGSDVVVLLCVK